MQILDFSLPAIHWVFIDKLPYQATNFLWDTPLSHTK